MYDSRQPGKAARATGGKLGKGETVGAALGLGLSDLTDEAVAVLDPCGEFVRLDDPRGEAQELRTRIAARKAKAFISAKRRLDKLGYR